MLSGIESVPNFEQVLTDIRWSSPYALQSLALAMSLSWILDFHQSRGTSRRLTLQQRSFSVGISMAALGVASMIAYLWMEGLGWFDGYATREEEFRIKSPLPMEWIVIKGMAIGAVVAWLVPMWFRINRSKAPDQIAGRAIMMNKRGLSAEIQQLEPDELIRAVAAVAASVAAIDQDVSRDEKDVYKIICSQLSGLRHSDVDIDDAEKEFDQCLQLIESDELQLEERLQNFARLPLLSSLMPFIASSIAFADGVYLDQERAVVEQIKRQTLSPESAPG
jgi:tellurite resistance protein